MQAGPQRHQQKFVLVENEIDVSARPEMESSEPFSDLTACLAFMLADCKHELRPVKSGFRLALVYSILNISTDPSPVPMDCSWMKTSITAVVEDWSADKDVPDVAIYVLDHRYAPG